jgi:hypothetical protein
MNRLLQSIILTCIIIFILFFLNIIHIENYFLYIYCYEKLKEHKILNLYL